MEEAMIEDIRKKHEADKIRYANSMRDRKWAVVNSTLSISDVDALLAALDAERGKVAEALKYMKEWGNWRTNTVDITKLKQILTGEG